MMLYKVTYPNHFFLLFNLLKKPCVLLQARDVEQTLMERTRQVCHLRWELLHRDMSAVLLQAALHRVTSQGEPVTILPTWDKRRNRFKNIKAWSVDTTTRRPSEVS